MAKPAWPQTAHSNIPQVFVDLAPLRTLSAFQGIGRYLRELLLTFAKLESFHWRDLAVFGLDTRSWPWRKVPLEALSEGLPQALPGERISEGAFRHRVAGFYLRKLGCACYHQAESRHTPLVAGVPLVLTIHDIIPLQFPRLYSRRAPRLRFALNWSITRWRLFQADHVITDSHYVAQLLAARFSVSRKRMTAVWPGVDLKRFHAQPALNEREILKEQWGLDSPYWLFVGTGDPRKNLPFLLDAVAAADSPEPLVLVGKIHPLHESAIKEAIRRNRLGGRVFLLGYVEDRWLPLLYRQSLGLLFPSLGEGFGLPVVEAMACGTPVVAFANSSIPEVAGDAAWLVPTNDLPAFVEAMKVLAVNHEKRQELVAKGLERAKLFTWENTARAVLGVYRRVLGLPQ
ncbi:MAG: hypothetical protein KatS3mg007_2027 [Thermoanaerobaculum sp.]|nr:MAG: hypothetical protein KatS3mg007_2027 [Thermoanaerobaculum sp.]